MITFGLFYLLVGLALISVGASLLVDSTEKLSRYLNLSHFISSLVFIGIATSSPEIFISIIASLNEKPNIAIGNALGSNIANIGLVFAFSLFFISFKEMSIKNGFNREENFFLRFLLFLTFLAFFLLYDGNISINDSIILFSSFVVFLFVYKFLFNQPEKNNPKRVKRGIAKNFFLLLIGLISLLFGTELFLKGSVEIAKEIGISDYIIGLSIAAIGTSIPELAASIESLRKKNIDFLIGNILGSNIFNIVIVMGIVGFINTSSVLIEQNDIFRDIFMILITTLMLIIITKNYNFIATRLTNLVLLISFIIYQYSLYQ